jgi:hypothetical protein
MRNFPQSRGPRNSSEIFRCRPAADAATHSERLRNVRPADLTENSVLLGASAQIIDTLKKVEAAGFDEVILYFNVSLKAHAQVKDEMARFMADVAPAFA